MSKVTISFELDLHEDFEFFQQIAHVQDLASANFRALETIRTIIKRHELSDEELARLRQIEEDLYIEGLSI